MNKYNFSSPVRKLIINQFGAAVFGFLIFQAGTMLSVYIQKNNGANASVDSTIDMIVCIISILFYMVLQYSAIWDIGCADKIKVDSNRFAYNKFTGLKAGLYANIPNFVLAFLVFFGALLFYMTGNELFSNLSGVTHNVIVVWESMFDGIIRFFKPSINPETNSITINQILLSLNYFSITIPSLFISFIGYIAGYNNKFKIGKNNK